MVTEIKDPNSYYENRKAFISCLTQALKEYGNWSGAREAPEPFTTRLATLARAAGLPEEEALMHAANELTDHLPDAEVDLLRERFHHAYFQASGKVLTVQQERVASQTAALERFLLEHFRFRYNEMRGYTEYARANSSASPQWKPVDGRALNGLVLEARDEGIDAWNQDVQRYVNSDRIPKYNALDAFMHRVDLTTWDGRDRIRELAATVPCRQPAQWRRWLERWLMGVYMQWRPYLDDRPFGNAVVPLLIGPQGWGKSRFCRRLLPEELQCGFTDSLVLDNKSSVLLAMNQLLLICLDEFNQYSPKVQEGFLKNVVQLASVMVKPPYGRRQVEMTRLASFIATSNQHDVLADASGSRRFIVIELKGPIDDSYALDHLQLFAQVAFRIHEQGKKWWFTQKETDVIIEHNRPYRLQQPVDLLFTRLFRPAQNSREGCWMLSSEIYEHLRAHKETAPLLKNVSLVKFGRQLTADPKIMRKRTKRGTFYRVVPLKME